MRRFISRARALVLLGQPYDSRLRNCEIENELAYRSHHRYVVSEPCPFDVYYCAWGSECPFRERALAWFRTRGMYWAEFCARPSA